MSQQPPRTVLGTLTQLVQNVRTQLDGSNKMELRPNAKVPELHIDDGSGGPPRVCPLVGDRYILGRSSQTSDIVVTNPIVSQTHVSFSRSRRKGTDFTIRDEGSTNGFYWKKKRYNSLELRHGDEIALGPPELANSVLVRFVYPPKWYWQALRYTGLGLGGLSLLLGLAIFVEWQKFSVKQLGSVPGPIAAYASDGSPLQTLRSESHQELKSLKDYSSYLPKAVVASEDSRYYWHPGFDPVRLASALLINVRSGGIREGASGLTQQIARSLYPKYVGKEDSLGRKLREVVVSLKLETFYSKDFLLLTYLNRVYLGVGYGFEDAAQEYFQKSAKDLSLSEAATLVGMLPAPNAYNPCKDPKTATGLRNRVINRMLELGMISREEASAGRRSAISIDPQVCTSQTKVLSPYFYSQIYQELEDLLGAEAAQEGNFIVETGLNPKMQATAEEILRDTIQAESGNAKIEQGAVVTLDAKTGSILALVGGVDYEASQFNRATQAVRQPGSTFKAFAYAAAIEKGISPTTTYSCAPFDWGGQGFDGCAHNSGDINMYTALTWSENPVALRIGKQVGLDAVITMARKLGIRSTLNAVPGLVLGQSEVTPLEMASAYSAFANQGRLNQPHAINRIYDASQCSDRTDRQTCRLVYDAAKTPGQNQQVISADLAETMTTMLQGVVQSGTGRGAAIGQGEAGKTGTTNDGVDLWFVGYVPKQGVVTSVWMGNDDNAPTDGSSAIAAQLWGNYMRRVLN